MIITWPAISIPETYMSLGVSTKCISGYLGPGIIIDQTILYLWHHQQEQKKETVWNSNWAIHSQGGCCCLPALNSFRISKTNSSLVFFLAGSFSCWCTSVLQTIVTSVCSYHHHHHHPNSSLFIENPTTSDCCTRRVAGLEKMSNQRSYSHYLLFTFTCFLADWASSLSVSRPPKHKTSGPKLGRKKPSSRCSGWRSKKPSERQWIG